MKTCSLLIICGIPGAGKTSIANVLCQNVSWEEKPVSQLALLGSQAADIPNPSLFLQNMKLVHICYDKILPNDLESDIIAEIQSRSVLAHQTVSEWKAYRNNIVKCVDWLLGVLHGSRGLSGNDIDPVVWGRFKANLQMTKANDIETEADNHILVIDDNMYYRSMRYEYYQLARKYNAGFGQLYLDCPLDTSLKRNKLRNSPVLEDVIIAMKAKLEPPNRNNPWEKFSLSCDTSEQNVDVVKVHDLISACMKSPVQPLVERDMAELEEARVQCSTNVIHQSDQILRHLVANHMSKAKGSGEGKDLKKMAGDINMKRTSILEKMRKGHILVPANIEGIHNAALDPDSTLYRFVQRLFNEDSASS